MRDGLAAIRQRAQFGPFVVPGPDVQLRVETLATLLTDVERLLAIAEAADIRSLRENQCVLCTGHPYGTHYEDCPLDQDTPQ